MNKKIYTLHIVFVIIVLCAIILFEHNTKLNFDNDSSKDILLTEKFSNDEIEAISAKIDYMNKKTSIHSIKQSTCIRSTDSGGYAIYLKENDEEYYVFFDENNRLIADAHVDRFASSEDVLIFEGCNSNEILELGGYVKFPYYSSREIGFFFLTDGVAQVTFDKPSSFADAKIIEIKILSNSDYLSMDISWKPYILPNDRYN